jgi:hypothetical protein
VGYPRFGHANSSEGPLDPPVDDSVGARMPFSWRSHFGSAISSHQDGSQALLKAKTVAIESQSGVAPKIAMIDVI